MSSPVDSETGITVVEFYMMDKRRYYPLAAGSGFIIRGMLYPFSVIRTRLQVQRQHTVYRGTFDAFRKIARYEGTRGLYRGFWVGSLLIVSQVSYVATYENVRQFLKEHNYRNSKVKSLVAGGVASVVGQTFMVPVDVVTQHLQLAGASQARPVRDLDPLRLSGAPSEAEAARRPFGMARAVIGAVYRTHGVAGFYSGYLASLCVYAPNSALWWFFYDIYCEFFADRSPDWVPRLVLQCTAAPLSSVTAAIISNPLDIVRARIQVENSPFVETLRDLWHEEHLGVFTKSLSARLIQSITFSFFIILGYETIKRWSLLEQYESTVRW